MEFPVCPILHIEDEENDSFLLARAFMSADIAHPIQVVKNGARAVSYLLGQPPFASREYYPMPCLILLDLNMPCMTGLEFLKWRQSQPIIKRIPVLVLTTSRLPEDLAAAYDAGANGYLVKPVSQEGLVGIVKAIRDFWLVHNTYAPPLERETPVRPMELNPISFNRRNGLVATAVIPVSAGGAI